MKHFDSSVDGWVSLVSLATSSFDVLRMNLDVVEQAVNCYKSTSIVEIFWSLGVGDFESITVQVFVSQLYARIRINL